MQDAWLTAAVRNCKATMSRYIETLGARRRYLADIASRDFKQRSRAERQAVNGICQARPESLGFLLSLTPSSARARSGRPSAAPARHVQRGCEVLMSLTCLLIARVGLAGACTGCGNSAMHDKGT